MTRDLKVMAAIQKEKAKEIERGAKHPLDAEGDKLAETKRFTFDIIDTPVDPLR